MKRSSVRYRLLSGLTLTLSAVSSWSADFTIGISNAQPGSRVLLPVNLSGPSIPVAMQFDVLYGSENLASEPIVKGPATFAHTVKSTLRSGGRRRVLIYATPVSEIPDGVIIEMIRSMALTLIRVVLKSLVP